jgi:hypothetical protein
VRSSRHARAENVAATTRAIGTKAARPGSCRSWTALLWNAAPNAGRMLMAVSYSPATDGAVKATIVTASPMPPMTSKGTRRARRRSRTSAGTRTVSIA